MGNEKSVFIEKIYYHEYETSCNVTGNTNNLTIGDYLNCIHSDLKIHNNYTHIYSAEQRKIKPQYDMTVPINSNNTTYEISQISGLNNNFTNWLTKYELKKSDVTNVNKDFNYTGIVNFIIEFAKTNNIDGRYDFHNYNPFVFSISAGKRKFLFFASDETYDLYNFLVENKCQEHFYNLVTRLCISSVNALINHKGSDENIQVLKSYLKSKIKDVY